MKKKHIKLFIASPSDVSDEREVFTDVIDAINRSRAHSEGYHLEAIKWEQYAYPEAENPQEIINKLLDEAALVIVLFWNKFGTLTEKLASGTMEEFLFSYRKKQVYGNPSIKIYFREPSAPKTIVQLRDLEKILEFKESIKNKALYADYETLADFRALLQEHINAWLSEYIKNPEKSEKTMGVQQIISQPSGIKNIMKDVYVSIEKVYDREEPKVRFGLEDLDDICGDLTKYNLIVVAGDHSSGKTSLMQSLTHYSSVKEKVPLLYFAFKSSKEELGLRLICSISELNSYKLRRGLLVSEDWIKLTLAAGALADSPIFIDDNPLLAMNEIKTKIEQLKSSHNIGIIIIDDLNYITNPQKIGQELRIMSRTFQVPIIVTLQINNQARKYDERPTMDDLNVFTDLKTESDIILFLHPNEMYGTIEDNKKPISNQYKIVEFIVAKHIAAPTETLHIKYCPQLHLFKTHID